MWFQNPKCQNHLFYCFSQNLVAWGTMKGINVGCEGPSGLSPAPWPAFSQGSIAHMNVCVYFHLGGVQGSFRGTFIQWGAGMFSNT